MVFVKNNDLDFIIKDFSNYNQIKQHLNNDFLQLKS